MRRHKGGHTGGGVVDGDGDGLEVTVTVGMVEEREVATEEAVKTMVATF